MTPHFDFENTPAWEVSTSTLLPVGNHVVTVDVAESTKTRNDNNQIELSLSNAQGSIRDWVVYAEENGVAKVVALFGAAGQALSNEDQDENGQLTPACVARLDGKKVGIVINEEPDYKDATKTRRRVKGYVAPGQVDADVPIDTSGLPAVSSQGADDDIPFMAEPVPFEFDPFHAHSNR